MGLVKSIAVFLGTVIGVGIFSLPFVSMKAGFFIASAYLFLMAFVLYKTHCLYAEIAFSESGYHRLPGYAEKYLGLNWKIASFIITAISFVCALIAYLIIGGQFLFNIFSPYIGGNALSYLFVFLILGAFVIFREIRMISKMEMVMLFAIILILAIIFFITLPSINAGNFLGFDFSNFFLPYGAIVFSLWGASIIPELKEMAYKKDKKTAKLIVKKTILLGISIASAIYFIFIFSVLGFSGKNTSSEAISGLKPLGLGVIWISSIFGFLCCFTSYITIGLTLKKSLRYDFKVPWLLSWIITVFLPVVIYFMGATEFINIIGFVGTITIGLEALIIILIHKKLSKSRFSYILASVFILGILLELNYFLR